MKFIAYYDSPLGKITLAGDKAGLCGLWFEGEKYYAHALAMGSTDGKFCARDIATKTDAAAREGCCEKGRALEAKSGAEKSEVAPICSQKSDTARAKHSAISQKLRAART